MNEHPDFLTMAQIVNGLDELDLGDSPIAWVEYIESITNVDIHDLMGAAQDEVLVVRMATMGKSPEVVGATAWATGFLFGLRISRDIKTGDLHMDDPMLGIDQQSIVTISKGRTHMLRIARHDGDLITMAKTTWLDGVCTGVHFDKARISA